MKLYSPAQAASKLGLAVRTIRYYVKIGRFKHVKTVKHSSMEYYYLTDATFRAFLAEYERSGPGGVYYKRKGNV